MPELNKSKIAELDEVPQMLHGYRFKDDERQKLSQGEKVFVENMQFSDNTLRDGYLWLTKNKDQKLEVSYQFKAQTLQIDDRILDHKLTKEEKDELQKGKVVGPLQLKADFRAFLQVDTKLNRVVIRSQQELGIPKSIGGYELSDIDQKRLANNEAMQPRVFKGEKGYFVANFKLTDDKMGHEYTNIKDLSKYPDSEIKKMISELNKDSNNTIDNVISVTEKVIASEVDKKDKYQALDQAIQKRDFNEISRLGNLHSYEPSKVDDLIAKNKLTHEESTGIHVLTKTGTNPSHQFKSALKEGRFNDLEKVLDNGYKPTPEEKVTFKKTIETLSKEQRTEISADRLSKRVLETEIKMSSSKEKQHTKGIGIS